ncbi:MAG TPA: SpoIID/LytB domain-containing protein [Nitrospirota bacterium]|nr:SpoIID/LytB domain-containing protein [Nitrospirota bacterium]
MKIKLILFTIAIICSTLPSFAFENIRVIIADDQKTVILTSKSRLDIEGNSDAEWVKKMTFSSATMFNHPIRVRSADELVFVDRKSYHGWIELRKKKNGRILVINDLDIEDYLKGVIPAEVPAHWEREALKAQAVASRTYALYQKGVSGDRPYHILSSVKSQVYNGSGRERLNVNRAVRETRGIVLAYQGKVIPAFYHASCGGHTENAAELWGIDEPYLKGVNCECQNIMQDALWEKRLTIPKVLGALSRLGYRMGTITDMSIKEITDAGRVRTISIRDAGKTILVPAEALRASLGNTVLPSVFYELEFIGNEAVFSGRGSGHGVGMCQWGAQEMALRGINYQTILQHYYPGTVLTRMK